MYSKAQIVVIVNYMLIVCSPNHSVANLLTKESEREDDQMSLGERIRKQRKALKITQQDLATALGMTPQHVSSIEQGKRVPSMGFLIKAAEELGVSIDYLVAGKEGVAAGIIPAIKADKGLDADTKKALIAIVKQLYEASGKGEGV